jgi:hypothetical protein
MLDVASNRVRNIFETRSQHARNIYLVVFRFNGWRLRIFKIQRPRTRPTLAPGSDVRALAVPLAELYFMLLISWFLQVE